MVVLWEHPDVFCNEYHSFLDRAAIDFHMCASADQIKSLNDLLAPLALKQNHVLNRTPLRSFLCFGVMEYQSGMVGVGGSFLRIYYCRMLCLYVSCTCLLYVLALNVHTCCMLYVLALKNSTEHCVASYLAIFVKYGEWVKIAIVSAWNLVLWTILL